MARKERNSVDYFPHPVNHGKGMFFIRQKYKNDGYAVWMILLEKLGSSEYHYLDLSDEIQLMYLSAECLVEQNTLKLIIDDLVKLGEFDFDLWNELSVLYNQKFVDSIEDAYKKRSNICITKNSLLLLLQSKGRSLSSKSILLDSKCNSKGDGNTQRKEKKRKEKETIREIEVENDWKTDFNIYVSELRIAFKEILTPEYISEREKFHPYLDISKTIEKACKDYWSTEEGWKNKKKSKTQTINWKSTFNNSLTQKMNQVYKPKNSDGSSGKPQHKFQY